MHMILLYHMSGLSVGDVALPNTGKMAYKNHPISDYYVSAL